MYLKEGARSESVFLFTLKETNSNWDCLLHNCGNVQVNCVLAHYSTWHISADDVPGIEATQQTTGYGSRWRRIDESFAGETTVKDSKMWSLCPFESHWKRILNVYRREWRRERRSPLGARHFSCTREGKRRQFYTEIGGGWAIESATTLQWGPKEHQKVSWRMRTI